MKLSDLFESDTGTPMVISMLQRLIAKGEKVYMLRFLAGGEEAGRLLQVNYTPATKNVGGGLHMQIVTQDESGDLRTRWIDLVHGIGADATNEFDSRWTISTIRGHKLFHMREKKQQINDLKDEIFFVDLPE